LQEWVILGESLEHWKRHDGAAVSNWILGFDFLHHLKVMWIGLGLGLENFVVELISEFAFDDLG
jgi:hypothetical protein